MYKQLIKLYFVASIVLIALVTVALAIVYFGESWTFYEATGLDYATIEQNLLLLIRLWIANVGVSSFIAVASYAKQESMDYTAKTALYTFVVNVIYGFVLIVILRRLLKNSHSHWVASYETNIPTICGGVGWFHLRLCYSNCLRSRTFFNLCHCGARSTERRRSTA
jgi:hypothetical protein